MEDLEYLKMQLDKIITHKDELTVEEALSLSNEVYNDLLCAIKVREKYN